MLTVPILPIFHFFVFPFQVHAFKGTDNYTYHLKKKTSQWQRATVS